MAEYQVDINIIESLVTIIALITGGIWAYLLFIKNREKYPKAIIMHSIHKVELESDILIRLTIKIENIGKVILQVKSGEVWLQHLLPYNEYVKEAVNDFQRQTNKDRQDVSWPLIENRVFKFEKGNDYELEPGEVDKFEFDFLIDKKIKTIQFYTHIKNIKKNNTGWNFTSIHNLD